MGRTTLWLLIAGCSTPSTIRTIALEGGTTTHPLTETTTRAGCETLEETAEGEAIHRGASTTHAIPPCHTVTHAVASSAGSMGALTLDAWPADSTVTVQVVDFHGQVIGEETGLTAGDTARFAHPWTGEALVRLVPDGPTPDDASYTVTWSCVDFCDRAYTRYPLFLMHGMAGTDTWIGLVDYWWGIVEELEDHGYRVFAPTVDPFEPPEVRARMWRDALDALDDGSFRHVHTFGHSQGGLDARYLATKLDPDKRVVTVTSVGVPHRGTVIADIFLGLVDDAIITEAVLEELADLYAQWVGAVSEQDLMRQVERMSTAGAAAFTDDVPDRDDVAYFSWTGRTCAVLDLICQSNNGGESVFLPLVTSFWLIELFEGENDGLVSTSSARWGTFLGTVPADHLNEVGHLVGSTAPGFDHLAWWVSEAERLGAWEHD